MTGIGANCLRNGNVAINVLTRKCEPTLSQFFFFAIFFSLFAKPKKKDEFCSAKIGQNEDLRKFLKGLKTKYLNCTANNFKLKITNNN